MVTLSVLGAVVAISVAPSKAPMNDSEPPLDAPNLEGQTPSGAAPGPRDAALVPVTASQGEEAQKALILSCDEALGRGSCVPFQAGAPEPFWAEVSFEPDAARVTLRESERRNEPFVSERTLSFSEADGRAQRQRAAGLLVAAMTAAAQLARSSEDQASQVEEPDELPQAPLAEELPPKDLAQPQRKNSTFSVEGAFVASPFVGASDWGFGGFLGLGFWPRNSFALAAEARFARAAGSDLSADAYSAALGAIVVVGRRDAVVVLCFHPQAVFESTRVFEVVPEGGSQFASRGGGRIGLSLAWGGHALAPFLGVYGTALAPTLTVKQDGELLRTFPPVTLSLALGLRIEP